MKSSQESVSHRLSSWLANAVSRWNAASMRPSRLVCGVAGILGILTDAILIGTTGGWDIATTAAFCVQVVFVLLIIAAPRTASSIMVMLSIIGALVPSTSLGSMTICVGVAMAIISYSCPAFYPSVLFVLSTTIQLVTAQTQMGDYRLGFWPVMLTAMGMTVGMTLHRFQVSANLRQHQAQEDRTRAELARLQRDLGLAAHLHDTLTNDLSYILTVASTQALVSSGDEREMWKQVRDRASDGFDVAHQTIDTLRGSQGNTASSSTRVSAHPSPMQSAVPAASTDAIASDSQSDSARKLVQTSFTSQAHDSQAALSALRFQGKVTVEDDLPALSADQLATGLDALREVFANVRRHCDPAVDTYEVTINADESDESKSHVHLHETNTVSGSHPFLGAVSGRGIGLLRRRVEALGGSVRIALSKKTGDAPTRWTIDVII
jgi:signal transduction histidine kinase